MFQRKGRFGIGRILVLFLLPWGILLGCDTPSESVGAVPENADDVFLVNKDAPEISLPNRAGETVSLKSLRGKVVMLNVWATWCVPCLNEMPALERAYQLLKSEGLEIVAVSVDSPGARGRVDKFIAENKITFPILLDPKNTVPAEYGMTGFPETLFIGRDGKFLKFAEPDGKPLVRVIGERPWDAPEYVEALRKLLKAN